MEGENELKLIFWLGTSVVLLLVVGLFFLVFIYQNYFLKMKQKQLISDYEKQALHQKLLLTQMNPHFIFNSIDKIKSLIHHQKNEQAENYLTHFSKLTRQILENSREDYIPFHEELAILENYFAIQQLLYNNKFTYTIDLAESIDTEITFVPPMLIQPFVENAIKHGLKNQSDNGIVQTRFYQQGAQLFFEVTDNGSGFDKNENTANHKSMAIAITKERLMNYVEKERAVIQMNNIIDDHGQVTGAKIVFEIPYIYEN